MRLFRLIHQQEHLAKARLVIQLVSKLVNTIINAIFTTSSSRKIRRSSQSPVQMQQNNQALPSTNTTTIIISESPGSGQLRGNVTYTVPEGTASPVNLWRCHVC